MKVVYKPFRSKAEIEAFFNEINNSIYIPVECWYREEGLKLYGCFYNKENKLDFSHLLFCFGRTICPDRLQPQCENSIFSKIKQYGSSCKYKGLKDIRGKEILRNMYDDIDFFYATGYDVFFIVRRGCKKGIYKFAQEKLEVISQLHFDDFFDAGEYTWGYVKNGNVGFMSLEGKLITEAKYQLSTDFNHFIEGKALTCLNAPNGIPHYINHYGDFVGYPEDDFFNVEHQLGTGYYPYGDLPDALDAYEDEEENIWNPD